MLPDGCIDVVFTEHCGTQLVGPNTVAFMSPMAPGTRVYGARMRPGGAPALLGVSAEALRDVRAPVQDWWGEPGERLAAALDTASDPLAVLCDWLRDRARTAPAPDPLIVAAVTRLDGSPVALATLAHELAVSERGLRRRVTAGVGYGPKRLARVLRLWRALAAIRGGEELARAAFAAGYADQAHFSGDCRELAGAPPTALV